MRKELIMYGRQYACADQHDAMTFLQSKQVPYRFVDVSRDAEAAHRLQSWVGHLSVPTLVVAAEGETLPIADPAPLDPARRVRGQDRGTLITEPSPDQLAAFLQAHELL